MGRTKLTPLEDFNAHGVGTAFVGLQDRELDNKERKFLRRVGLGDHDVARLCREAKPHYKPVPLSRKPEYYHA